ncbi:hypothetical protein HL670_03047 [Serratia plymuthica]|uniref:hypothetical protein n=1 Tax=Serratia plymuthica TaxID=82996 RepID=UPI0007871786|nr:hypothetical protein [Serratia plymuthica]QJW56158.1 hypothetical protein HL670_03047 [Serratia plymuthica]
MFKYEVGQKVKTTTGEISVILGTFASAGFFMPARQEKKTMLTVKFQYANGGDRTIEAREVTRNADSAIFIDRPGTTME